MMMMVMMKCKLMVDRCRLQSRKNFFQTIVRNKLPA